MPTQPSASRTTVPLGPITLPPDRYRYRLAGTGRPLPPDRDPDHRTPDPEGWLAHGAGGPFDGRSISWQALTVRDQGVDLECIWDEPPYVDRILFDPSALTGVQRIRVLTMVGDHLRQIGQIDHTAPHHEEYALETEREVWIDVGRPLASCVIRFETRLAELSLPGGLTVVGTTLPLSGLFPPAVRTESSGPGPNLTDLAAATIVPIGGPEGTAVRIAEHLRGRTTEALGLEWPVAAAQSGDLPAAWQDCAAIALDLAEPTAPRPPLADIVSALGAPPGAEGFALVTTADRVLMIGQRRGLRHAAESVLQQLTSTGNLVGGTVVEEPAHAFRGVHLPLPGPSQVAYFRRLIRWLVLPARYNTVIIEIAGGMEFTRHPEINEVWQRTHADAVSGRQPMPPHFDMVAPGECLPQQTVRALVSELSALDLEVIPEVQSLSHVEYLTLAHPDIAEVAATDAAERSVDLFTADSPPTSYPSCYCPSLPAAQALISDVLNEILDVFEPERFVHLGHDEVYQLGVCPRCREADPADLFTDDVNRLCAVVAERGLQPIIWSDLLQPDTPYRAAAALDRLPDDLLMMDFIWYFHRDSDTETHLLDHGRQVIIGNLYSSHFPRWESRSQRPGVIGGQTSTWVPLDDEVMAREGKYVDLCLVGAMLWGAQYHRHHRWSATERVAQFLPHLRARLTGSEVSSAPAGQPVELLPHQVASPLGDARTDPLLAALLARVDGPVGFAGSTVRYEISRPVTLPRSDLANSPATSVWLAIPPGVREVHLVQALARPFPRVAWERLPEIGRHRFLAESGEEIGCVPVTPGGTVGQLHRRWAAPLPTSYFRHQGYTATYQSDAVSLGQLDDGRELCVYRSIWRAPSDAPAPAALVVETEPDTGTALVLCTVTAWMDADQHRMD